MHIVKKVNLKKYFLLSVPSTAVCFFMAESALEVLAIFSIYLATIINQSLLVELVVDMTRVDGKRMSKQKYMIFFVGKFAVMIAALSFGVQVMGKRVILSILNYVFMIFLLVISVKKVSK